MAMLFSSAQISSLTDDEISFRLSMLRQACDSLKKRTFDDQVKKAIRDMNDTRSALRREMRKREKDRNLILEGFEELLKK